MATVILDCKTAPSFTRSPKIGVFEQVFTCGREMGEAGRGRSRAARGKRKWVERRKARSDFWRKKGLFCSLL